MNARDNIHLRDQIIAFLKARDEATLKQIAAATTERNFPSRVTSELNKMRTDALVECEKKKGKNELWYWLAAPANAVMQDAQPEVAKNAGSSASVPSSHSAEGAAVHPEPAPHPPAQPVDAVAEDEPAATAEQPAVPEPDFSLLMVIADIRAAIGDPTGKIMLGELAEHIRGRIALLEAEPAALRAELAKADSELDQVRALLSERIGGEIDPNDMSESEIARAAAAMIDALNEQEAQTIIGQRAEIEALQREAMRGATCLSGKDRYTAAGYLVRATKRKPRTLQAEHKARDAAMAAIRAGAPRAEVFALVPVGHARRGAEWRSA